MSAVPAGSAAAADSYQVGFRTLGQWSADTNLRLDVNIWYPSLRPPRELNYAPWTIAAARNGKPVEGRFPLLLLSHASPGTRFSYHDTAAWLASCGFVVAAPTHSQDCMDNMSLLFTWRQLETRAKELSSTIDLLLADQELAASIDKNRIGLLGFGTGGTAALQLAKGDMVRHRAFGQGMVLSIQPMGGDALVEIAFDNVGTKRLMLKFAAAQMEKI